MSLAVTIGTLGSDSIGFVLGWTLYFANRGKSGDLSVAELGAIAGVIAGSTVITFLDGFGIPDAQRVFLFGGYGIGVLIGFMTYFQLFRLSLRKDAESGAGEVLRSPAEASSYFKTTNDLMRSGPVMQPRSRAPIPTRSELDAAIAAAEAVSSDLALRRANATDPSHADYDEEESSKIRALQQDVSGALRTLYMIAALQDLNSDVLRGAINTLESETDALKTEASRLKTASADINKLTEMFEMLNALIEETRKLF